MCIIAIKDYNIPAPSKDIVTACFRANPDGAGVAILRPGADVVEISKGFMGVDDYFDFITSAVQLEDYAVYHFRIATSGGKRPELTHPFPVSDNAADLMRLQTRTRFAFIHNGILGKGKNGLSDTQLYVKNKLFPLRYSLHRANIQDKINTDTRGSRTVTIDAQTGLILKTGAWITDNDTGLVFSNTSYRDESYYMDWWDDTDTLMQSGYRCPNCTSYTTDLISVKHRLIECDNCDCLFDMHGKIWTYGK